MVPGPKAAFKLPLPTKGGGGSTVVIGPGSTTVFGPTASAHTHLQSFNIEYMTLKVIQG